jgi:hypothetical protein
VRLFRAPNSRHPKTGLDKRRLTLDELLHLDAARVRQLAAAPEPFALPAVTAADPQAAADWQAALLTGEREAEASRPRPAGGGPDHARGHRRGPDLLR